MVVAQAQCPDAGTAYSQTSVVAHHSLSEGRKTPQNRSPEDWRSHGSPSQIERWPPQRCSPPRANPTFPGGACKRPSPPEPSRALRGRDYEPAKATTPLQEAEDRARGHHLEEFLLENTRPLTRSTHPRKAMAYASPSPAMCACPSASTASSPASSREHSEWGDHTLRGMVHRAALPSRPVKTCTAQQQDRDVKLSDKRRREAGWDQRAEGDASWEQGPEGDVRWEQISHGGMGEEQRPEGGPSWGQRAEGGASWGQVPGDDVGLQRLDSSVSWEQGSEGDVSWEQISHGGMGNEQSPEVGVSWEQRPEVGVSWEQGAEVGVNWEQRSEEGAVSWELRPHVAPRGGEVDRWRGIPAGSPRSSRLSKRRRWPCTLDLSLRLVALERAAQEVAVVEGVLRLSWQDEAPPPTDYTHGPRGLRRKLSGAEVHAAMSAEGHRFPVDPYRIFSAATEQTHTAPPRVTRNPSSATVTCELSFRCRIPLDLQHAAFPYDRHALRLPLTFRANTYEHFPSPGGLPLTGGPRLLADFSLLPRRCTLDTSPHQLVVVICLERRTAFWRLGVILPTFSIVLLAIGSFLLPPTLPPAVRVAVPSLLVLALLALKAVAGLLIARLLPPITDARSTWLDGYFSQALIYLVFSAGLTAATRVFQILALELSDSNMTTSGFDDAFSTFLSESGSGMSAVPVLRTTADSTAIFEVDFVLALAVGSVWAIRHVRLLCSPAFPSWDSVLSEAKHRSTQRRRAPAFPKLMRRLPSTPARVAEVLMLA